MPATHYTADTTILPRQFTIGGQAVNVQWHHIINSATFASHATFLNAIGWDNDLIAKNLVPLAADERSK